MTLLRPSSVGNQSQEHGMIEIGVTSALPRLVSYTPDDTRRPEIGVCEVS
jgi:hypothetical protein